MRFSSSLRITECCHRIVFSLPQHRLQRGVLGQKSFREKLHATGRLVVHGLPGSLLPRIHPDTLGWIESQGRRRRVVAVGVVVTQVKEKHL
jgi:hypothetical protein